MKSYPVVLLPLVVSAPAPKGFRIFRMDRVFVFVGFERFSYLSDLDLEIFVSFGSERFLYL